MHFINFIILKLWAANEQPIHIAKPAIPFYFPFFDLFSRNFLNLRKNQILAQNLIFMSRQTLVELGSNIGFRNFGRSRNLEFYPYKNV